MARFEIAGNNLYAVSGKNLNIYDISNPNNLQFLNSSTVPETILSIRNLKDSFLLIGNSIGITAYTVSLPFQSTYSIDGEAYDPFTYYGKYLYLTEHTGSGVSRYITKSNLQVFNINNLFENVYFYQKVYYPTSLIIQNQNLFVCDSGLKVFDITNPLNIILKHHFNIKANILVPNSNNLVIQNPDGIYQYQYANDTITELSKININP